MRGRRVAIGFVLALAGASVALAQIPPVPPDDLAAAGPAVPGSGKDLYLRRCAGCHGAVPDPERDARSGPTRIPTRAGLARMPAGDILEALTYGPMQDMALGLTDADLASIAAFLTAKP